MTFALTELESSRSALATLLAQASGSPRPVPAVAQTTRIQLLMPIFFNHLIVDDQHWIMCGETCAQRREVVVPNT